MADCGAYKLRTTIKKTLKMRKLEMKFGNLGHFKDQEFKGSFGYTVILRLHKTLSKNRIKGK